MVSAVTLPEVVVENAPLPMPDPHMQDLAWFIGTWAIQSHMLTDAESDTWLDETLRAGHTLEMGGHLIFEHFYGPLSGTPFEAWSLRKYNVNTGRWEQRWVDTSPGGFINWIGSWTAEGQHGRFIGYAGRFVDTDLNLTGNDGLREIFDHIEPNRFSWRLEQTKDGGHHWKVIWTLEYSRIPPE